MKRGTKVCMSPSLKAKLRNSCTTEQHQGPMVADICIGCSLDHLVEFGNCIGEVEGLVNWNCHDEHDLTKIGPEVDVRWLPSKLRYAYDPKDLEEVDDVFVH